MEENSSIDMADKKALNNRGLMEVNLGTAVEELSEYCGQDSPGVRRVERLLSSLKSAWHELMNSHVSYCSAKGMEVGSVESQAYIKEQRAVYFAGKAAGEQVLDKEDVSVDDTQEQMGLGLKREISYMQLEIDNDINCLSKVLGAAALSAEGYKEAGEMMKGLEQKLSVGYQSLYGRLGDYLKADEVKPEKEKAEKFLDAKRPVFGELKTKWIMAKSPVREEGIPGEGSGSAGRVERNVKRSVKTAPIPVPKWDGKTRSFPRFKKLWTENILPFHEESALHMMLVQSLPTEVLDEVSSLASSYQEIWDHLEEKAGKSEVIARDIMGDLFALNHKKSGSKFLARFSVLLEDSEALLISIGQQAWMTSPRSIADLEDLLPPSEKLEWAKKVKGTTGVERFEKFKTFLRNRKEELEALETIGNKATAQVEKRDGIPTCTYCHKRGHSEMQGEEISCYAKRDDLAKGGYRGRRGESDKGKFIPDYRNGCAVCGDRNHWKNECPDKGTDRDRFNGRRGGQPPVRGGRQGRGRSVQADGEVNSNQLRRAECNRCKFANKNQSSCVGCKKNGNIDHCLLHCTQYMCLGLEDRVKLVKASNACAICLSSSHLAANCNYKDKDNWVCGMDGCVSHHHPTLHGSRDVYVKISTVVLGESRFQEVTDWEERENYLHDSYQVGDAVAGSMSSERRIEMQEVREELKKPGLRGDQVLLVVQNVNMLYGAERLVTTIVTFFDDGSTCSVILNSVAKQFGLLGEKVTVTIETLNAVTTKETMLYMVELLDRKGIRRLVRAFGFDTISEPMGSIVLDEVKYLFSKQMQKQWEDWGVRPEGAVQLLVGSEVAQLHPIAKEVVGNLVIKISQFGTGLVLNGGHSVIKSQKLEFDSTVAAIRQGKFVKVNRVTVKYSQERDFTPVEYMEGSASCGMMKEKDFLQAESLGVEAPRRCKKCSGCSECSFRGRQMSQKEAAEYKLIEEGIEFDQKLGRFRVKYPFIDDPRKLSNNYRQVVKIAESEERKLAKENLTEQANKLFDKMLEVGAIAELSRAEMDMWDGPVHYLSIQHVTDPSSATTPLRLVTNSSLADPVTGISLNSILAKGPCVLNDMFEILIRFRLYDYGLISDVSKAYYMLLTGLLEMHVRRVVWRYGKKDTAWRIFVFLTVSMGDRPAACLMEVAVKMTVLIFGHIDLVASHRLNRDRFVDDIGTGGSKSEVERFKGVENVETLVCDGTMPQIMGSTHLLLKAIGVSGEIDGEKLKKLGASVLGLGFSTERDCLRVKFRANTSVKKRGSQTGPDWSMETIGGLEEVILTMRLSMGVANCQYDPLGIGCPLVIRLKVAMGEMYRRKLSWDEPLPADLQKHLKQLISLVVEAGELEFQRCTKPKDAEGRCVMVVYFDGADYAFSAVVYLRWKVKRGGYIASLLVAKARVSAMWGSSTPRVELNGAVMAVRLAYRAVRSFNPEDMPERVYFLGDSETVLASREKNSGFFGEYYGNRIGETFDVQAEIQKLTQVGDNGDGLWWHVKSSDNAADRPSRLDTVPADIDLGSRWQTGPDYLTLDRADWPVERNFADRKNKVQIPKEEIVRKYRGLEDCGYINLHDLVDHRGEEEPQSQLISKVEDKVNKSGKWDAKCKVIGPGCECGGPGSKENDVLRQYFKFGNITNDWEKLLRKTAVLFQWRVRMLKKKGVAVTGRDMAEMFWMRVAMPATNKAGTEGKLKHLTPKRHDVYGDVVVVTGRALEGMKHYLQRDFLPVIMSSTRSAQLVTLWAHTRDHSGVDVTYMTATHVAWIVGGRALARRVKQSCVRCRYLAKLLEGQQMAVLPARLTVPCPVFSHVGVDLAGPFLVRKEGNLRATRGNTGTIKIWVILFVCLSTKALKLYVAGGYATEDFLLAWDAFAADHGDPLTCHSDRGSQIVAAAKMNPDLEVPNYDFDVVSRKTKTAWHFTPAQAQFRNGAVEIFVRKFKRTLEHKFKGRKMRLLEMETALKIVASVANSRPLSARYGPKGGCDPDFLTPLTPNMMLTGRAGCEIPIRDYETSSNPLIRLEYVQRVVQEWWDQFKVQNFTSLVPTQRWQRERRNICVGDVVLVHYTSKSFPGTYRLARVKQVEVDEVDGLVHTCTVVYSLLAELKPKDRAEYKGITKKELRVPVQRLVLILPIEEAEVQRDKVLDEEAEEGVEADVTSEPEVEEAEVASVQELAGRTGYSWGELGPSLMEHGETNFLAVMRKDTRVFDLVNSDWYRSDTVSNADPTSSSTDLWFHSQCSIGRDQPAAEHSSEGHGNTEASEEEVDDEAIELKFSDLEEDRVGKLGIERK